MFRVVNRMLIMICIIAQPACIFQSWKNTEKTACLNQKKSPITGSATKVPELVCLRHPSNSWYFLTLSEPYGYPILLLRATIAMQIKQSPLFEEEQRG